MIRKDIHFIPQLDKFIQIIPLSLHLKSPYLRSLNLFFQCDSRNSQKDHIRNKDTSSIINKKLS